MIGVHRLSPCGATRVVDKTQLFALPETHTNRASHALHRHTGAVRFRLEQFVSNLRIAWADIEGLRRFDNMLTALGDSRMKTVAARALNRVGSMAKTQVVRALPRQTGLKRVVIVKAIGKAKTATFNDLSYVMKAQGGDIALKYFAARETRRGVSAQPFGHRKVFPGTFMMAGRFPKRVAVAAFHGQVFERAGAERFPIEKQKSGVIIPVEMVKGATADAFTRSVRTNLPRRIEHELKRISGGALS